MNVKRNSNVGWAMIVTCLALWLAQSVTEATITLARDGASEYRIVIPANASEVEKLAAAELQTFLTQMSRADLPIISDDQPSGAREIILGNNRHLNELGLPVNVAPLGQEGFRIQTVGSRLVIVGGPANGTLYGVYGFLEDHLGCHWLSSQPYPCS